MDSLSRIFYAALLLLLAACGGGGGSSSVPSAPIADNGGDGGSDESSDNPDDSCGVPAQLDFIEQVSQSWYLWFDELEDFAAQTSSRVVPLLVRPIREEHEHAGSAIGFPRFFQ